MKEQSFKASDLRKIFPKLTSRQISHQISKMKESGFIVPFVENGHTYYINFMNNFLMRGLVRILEVEGFIPEVEQ